jgi:hypothetical protein
MDDKKIDYTLDFLRKNNLLTGDPGKDRRTYISLNSCGDIDPDENPLHAELEAELPEEFQKVKPLDVI